MRAVVARGGGPPPPNGPDCGSDMEVNPPPPAIPPKWIGARKNPLKTLAALHVLPGEPQPHQIFHQPSNVEPQWACMCKRQAHNKANTDY